MNNIEINQSMWMSVNEQVTWMCKWSARLPYKMII